MRKNVESRGIFGREFLKMRKTAGLSAENFALAIGVSKNTIYRWENASALPAPRAWSAIVEWCKHNDYDITALSQAYVHSGFDSL